MDNIFERKKGFSVFLTMALPLVFSQLLNMVYNIADTYFISYEQNVASVAAVSLCSPIFIIQMAIGNLLAQGGCSLVSRLLGEKNYDGIKKANSFVFYTALMFSVILAALLMVFRNPLLLLMGADSSTMDSAIPYYTVMALSSPLMVLSFVPSNLLRSEGLAKEAMAGSVIGTVVNLILDPIFIILLGLGPFGAALATVIANAASVMCSIGIMIKKSKCLSLDPKHYTGGIKFAKDVFSIGTSAALMNILMAVTQMIYNQTLLTYGSDKIAAFGIAMKIFYVPFMVIDGFCFGIQPVVGYYFGAKDKKQMYRIIKQVFWFQIICAVGFSVLLFVIAPVLIPCFLKDPEIVATGVLMLRVQAYTLAFIVIHMLTTIIFQSTGKARSALILSLTREGFMFIIVLIVMKNIFGYMGVIWAQSVTNVLSAGLALLVLLYVYRHRTLR